MAGAHVYARAGRAVGWLGGDVGWLGCFVGCFMPYGFMPSSSAIASSSIASPRPSISLGSGLCDLKV